MFPECPITELKMPVQNWIADSLVFCNIILGKDKEKILGIVVLRQEISLIKSTCTSRSRYIKRIFGVFLLARRCFLSLHEPKSLDISPAVNYFYKCNATHNTHFWASRAEFSKRQVSETKQFI